MLLILALCGTVLRHVCCRTIEGFVMMRLIICAVLFFAVAASANSPDLVVTTIDYGTHTQTLAPVRPMRYTHGHLTLTIVGNGIFKTNFGGTR